MSVASKKTKTVYKVPALRFIREEAGISQTKLASLAEIGRATVARLERGDVGANGVTLAKLAKALGVHREALLLDENASVHIS